MQIPYNKTIIKVKRYWRVPGILVSNYAVPHHLQNHLPGRGHSGLQAPSQPWQVPRAGAALVMTLGRALSGEITLLL